MQLRLTRVLSPIRSRSSIQVKQSAKVGRPDIDAFEAVLICEERKLGYFVGFDFDESYRLEGCQHLTCERLPSRPDYCLGRPI